MKRQGKLLIRLGELTLVLQKTPFRLLLLNLKKNGYKGHRSVFF